MFMQMISIFAWAHLLHCRRLSQTPYTLMPKHGHGCICKWFPYLGTPVALSQALSGPIPPSQYIYIGLGVYANDFHIWAHRPVVLSQALSGPIYPCQYTGLGVYANDFHIWAHLSHCRRLSQAPYTPMPKHGPGCMCR